MTDAGSLHEAALRQVMLGQRSSPRRSSSAGSSWEDRTLNPAACNSAGTQRRPGQGERWVGTKQCRSEAKERHRCGRSSGPADPPWSRRCGPSRRGAVGGRSRDVTHDPHGPEDAATLGDGPPSNRFGPEDPRPYVRQLADRWRDVVPETVGEVRTTLWAWRRDSGCTSVPSQPIWSRSPRTANPVRTGSSLVRRPPHLTGGVSSAHKLCKLLQHPFRMNETGRRAVSSATRFPSTPSRSRRDLERRGPVGFWVGSLTGHGAPK